MHHASVSTNYPWLPHHSNNNRADVSSTSSTPVEYRNMPIQPLGNIQARYEHYMQGCINYIRQQQ
jgi:prolyl 4-hydroxylase